MFAFALLLAVASADFAISREGTWVDGQFSVTVIGKCQKLPQGSTQFVKESETKYKDVFYESSDCSGNGEDGEITDMTEFDEVFVKELPPHIARIAMYSGNKCEGYASDLAFTAVASECSQNGESGCVKNEIVEENGKKIVKMNTCTCPSDNTPVTPAQSETTTDTESESKEEPATRKRIMKREGASNECDSCTVFEEGAMSQKLFCTAYDPNTSNSNNAGTNTDGSVSMTLLAVLLAIVFLF